LNNQSFAEVIEDIHLMLGGLTKNADRLAKRGVSTEFISKFSTAFDELRTLDQEKAALIARQKEKTSAINEKLNENLEYYREARKIIKLDLPQESWKEYGITAQK
jgi:phage regulator Rha-like protein